MSRLELLKMLRREFHGTSQFVAGIRHKIYDPEKCPNSFLPHKWQPLQFGYFITAFPVFEHVLLVVLLENVMEI